MGHEDRSPGSGTVRDRLVGFDGVTGILVVEGVDELWDTGNARETADEDEWCTCDLSILFELRKTFSTRTGSSILRHRLGKAE